MDTLFLLGDVREQLRRLPDASVQCCVTSPPYFGLRDYGREGQIGLEGTPDAFVGALVDVFRDVRRVLRDDGTLWLNLGDSYAGSGPSGASYQSATTKRREAGDGTDGAFRVSKTLSDRGLTYAQKKPIPPPGFKPKDLIGIPWRVAFALQADGWYLRQDIIWHKPNPMPESVRDRCTKAHEYIFLLAKSERYYFDSTAIQEPEAHGSGHRNRRSVWTVTTKPFKGAHFATFPPDLIEPCILAGSKPGDVVLDPFGGAGTTALVSRRHGRRSVYIDLNPDYLRIAQTRLAGDE
jgi:site-specific DNA-methyltransferase (adenine-specific)